MLERNNIKELIGFCIVGGVSTVINYGLFFLLFYVLDVFYIYSSGSGYIAGILFGYVLNKKWTFKATTQTIDDWWRYALVYAMSLFLGLSFLVLLVDFFGINALISNVLMIGLTTVTNFLGVKLFAFNPNSPKIQLQSILYDDRGFFRFSILLHPLFWVGLLLKIIIGSLLASDYMTDLFIPFVDYWVESGFDNPYKEFSNLQPEPFPYPPLMLFILGIPRFLVGLLVDFGGEPLSAIKLFTYRIPLIIADISILVIMARWLKSKKIQLLVWYWLNPVLLYITYIHGQLDVIPIALLFFSLHAFIRDKYFLSAFILGTAIATKFNIILVFPFWCVYLFREKDFKWEAYLYSGLVLLIAFLVNLPFLSEPAFVEMVYSNSEQQKIYDIVISFGTNLSIYVIPAILLSLIIRSLTIKTYSKDVFLMFLAFSFGVILIFIPPMPGWHYWTIPFFVFYFIKDRHSPKFFLGSFLVSYLVYFGLSPDSDYLEVFQLFDDSLSTGFFFNYLNQMDVNVGLLLDMSYTIMQVLLVVIVFWIYFQGFNKNRGYKLYNKSFLIGIGGDSGSGKTTLSELLKGIFHESNMETLRGDDMHKWERNDENWSQYTHLNPAANLLHENKKHLDELVSGNQINRRQYDHSHGKFTEPIKTNSNKLIIFEGLHPFYLKSTRDIYDLKIFMEPDENLRYHWKIVRDMEKRGYSKDRVVQELQKREEDSEEYIRSQAKYADLRVQFTAKNLSQPGDDDNFDVELKLICSSHANIDDLAHRLSWLPDLSIYLKYDKDSNQYLKISGRAKTDELLYILYESVPELEEVNWRKPDLKPDLLGVLQIIVCYMVFAHLDNK